LAQPEFIYFDIDDTLLDHGRAQEAALQAVYTASDCFEEVEFEEFCATYTRINTDLWKAYSLGTIDRAQLQHHRFADALLELGLEQNLAGPMGLHYLEAYRLQWKWIEGAREAIERLIEVYPIGFITNGFSETQKKKIEAFSLHTYSGHIIISEDVGFLKPSPELFGYAAQLAGVSANQILYVGDNFMSDIQGGNSAGWQTAWFTNEMEAEKTSQANYVFSKFETLTQSLLK